MKKLFVFAVLFHLCAWAFAGDALFKEVKRLKKLASECQAGKKKSCEKFLAVVLATEDPVIGKEAVDALSDQAILLDVAKKAKSPTVRLYAGRRLTSQADVASIAKADASPDVRRTLVNEKLTDQAALEDIARNDSSPGVREEAVRKMTNQRALAGIAKGDGDPGVRAAAVGGLSDQVALLEIARRKDDAKTSDLAWGSVHDQALLAQVATTDPDEAVREEAVRRLNSQETLAEVAKRDGSAKIRTMAVGKLTDPARLMDVSKNAGDVEIRKAAGDSLRRIEGATLLKACLSVNAQAIDTLLKEGKSLSGNGEASRALMEILVRRTERSMSISSGGFQGFSGPSEREQKKMLDAFGLLLKAGADPAAMKIQGFKPAGEERMGPIVRYSSGSPGRVVPVAEGGLSAMEFCEMNRLDDFKAALVAAAKR